MKPSFLSGTLITAFLAIAGIAYCTPHNAEAQAIQIPARIVASPVGVGCYNTACPGLKANSTTLQATLGDGSALTDFTSQTVTATTGTITADEPGLSTTQTWNNAAILGPAIKANVTDTSSNASALLMDLQVGGASKFKVDKSGIATIPQAGGLLVSSSAGVGYNGVGQITAAAAGAFNFGSSGIGTPDVWLYRDAANAAGFRNGTSANNLCVYNTSSSSNANYERGCLDWQTSANTLTIGMQGAGTGSTTRTVNISTGGLIQFVTNGSGRWQVNSSGHFLAAVDNTYDIGASGATRPRNLYVAGTGTFGGNVTSSGSFFAGNTGGLFTTSQGSVTSSSDGIWKFQNNAGTDFSRLQFGGTTASFGAIARDGAGVKIVGADGTSVSWVKVPGVTVASLPAAATAGVGAISFVTDANTTLILGLGAAVVGGGANKVPVYSDGANWIVGENVANDNWFEDARKFG